MFDKHCNIHSKKHPETGVVYNYLVDPAKPLLDADNIAETVESVCRIIRAKSWPVRMFTSLNKIKDFSPTWTFSGAALANKPGTPAKVDLNREAIGMLSPKERRKHAAALKGISFAEESLACIDESSKKVILSSLQTDCVSQVSDYLESKYTYNAFFVKKIAEDLINTADVPSIFFGTKGADKALFTNKEVILAKFHTLLEYFTRFMFVVEQFYKIEDIKSHDELAGMLRNTSLFQHYAKVLYNVGNLDSFVEQTLNVQFWHLTKAVGFMFLRCIEDANFDLSKTEVPIMESKYGISRSSVHFINLGLYALAQLVANDTFNNKCTMKISPKDFCGSILKLCTKNISADINPEIIYDENAKTDPTASTDLLVDVDTIRAIHTPHSITQTGTSKRQINTMTTAKFSPEEIYYIVSLL